MELFSLFPTVTQSANFSKRRIRNQYIYIPLIIFNSPTTNYEITDTLFCHYYRYFRNKSSHSHTDTNNMVNNVTTSVLTLPPPTLTSPDEVSNIINNLNCEKCPSWVRFANLTFRHLPCNIICLITSPFNCG